MKKITLIFFIIISCNGFAQKKSQAKDTCQMQVPTAWSVNMEGDGIWRISTNCTVLNFNIDVYSRWGLKMHSQESLANDNIITWDFKKKEVAAGTYFYIINYKVMNGRDTLEKELKGSFSVMK